jgi:hypothetical protein
MHAVLDTTSFEIFKGFANPELYGLHPHLRWQELFYPALERRLLEVFSATLNPLVDILSRTTYRELVEGRITGDQLSELGGILLSSLHLQVQEAVGADDWLTPIVGHWLTTFPHKGKLVICPRAYTMLKYWREAFSERGDWIRSHASHAALQRGVLRYELPGGKSPYPPNSPLLLDLSLPRMYACYSPLGEVNDGPPADLYSILLAQAAAPDVMSASLIRWFARWCARLPVLMGSRVTALLTIRQREFHNIPEEIRVSEHRLLSRLLGLAADARKLQGFGESLILSKLLVTREEYTFIRASMLSNTLELVELAPGEVLLEDEWGEEDDEDDDYNDDDDDDGDGD